MHEGFSCFSNVHALLPYAILPINVLNLLSRHSFPPHPTSNYPVQGSVIHELCMHGFHPGLPGFQERPELSKLSVEKFGSGEP